MTVRQKQRSDTFQRWWWSCLNAKREQWMIWMILVNDSIRIWQLNDSYLIHGDQRSKTLPFRAFKKKYTRLMQCIRSIACIPAPFPVKNGLSFFDRDTILLRLKACIPCLSNSLNRSQWELDLFHGIPRFLHHSSEESERVHFIFGSWRHHWSLSTHSAWSI